MRIERLSNNQFSIFLTFDDLFERGFSSNEFWNDAKSVRNLFSDMVHEASSELGLELEGMLSVQVYLMQAQGMHVTVTQHTDNENEWDDDFIEMKVTLDESNEMIFSFADFEHIIQISRRLSTLNIDGGKVFYLDDSYYMILEDEDLLGYNREDMIAVMSEYSYPTIITSHRLFEYGKPIYHSNAVKAIRETFLT